MAVAPRQRKQSGQTKKGDIGPGATPPVDPLSALMDMFGLMLPMEQPATGTTMAEKGPTSPSFNPGVTNRNLPANTMSWGPDGRILSQPPAFQPMTTADQNMATEQMNQAGDMANQVNQWDPWKGMVPNVGAPASTVPFPQMSPATMGEAPIEQAYGAASGQQPALPKGQPLPSAVPPMPDRNVNAEEQRLIEMGRGQFGYGTGAQPLNQMDALSQLFAMIGGGL